MGVGRRLCAVVAHEGRWDGEMTCREDVSRFGILNIVRNQ